MASLIPPAIRRILKRHLTIAAILLAGGAAACGGSSAGPTTSAADVSGAWSGTATYDASAAGNRSFSMTLSQSAAGAITGTWQGQDGKGTVAGSLAGNTFAGQLVWEYPSTGGAANVTCTRTVNLTGNAGGRTMTWTSVSITPPASPACAMGVSSVRIDVTHQ